MVWILAVWGISLLALVMWWCNFEPYLSQPLVGGLDWFEIGFEPLVPVDGQPLHFTTASKPSVGGKLKTKALHGGCVFLQ